MNREPTPTDPESRRALEWARRQQKNVSLSVPTRTPNESPANDAQRAELRELGVTAPDSLLAALGARQAAAAIERLRQENRQFTEECAHKWIAMRDSRLGWGAAIIVTIAVMLFLCGR